MIRRIAEVAEVDIDKANELLKKEEWVLYRVYGNDNTLEVKYVMARYEMDDDYRKAFGLKENLHE